MGNQSHETPSLSHAYRALAAGDAVVVPNPAPLAYGVVATRARAVNACKGRALDQNVAASMHDRSEWERLAPEIDLPATVLRSVRALLELRLSLLLPLRDRMAHPDWFTPAVRDGNLAVFNGYWEPTATLWEAFPRLYGSSANLTGQPPAASAAEARAHFGPHQVVVDAGESTPTSGPRRSSTMLRLDRAGGICLHRSGAQDSASGLGAQAYLARLADRVGLSVSPVLAPRAK
ncbi:Sua5/YciO/YrdC/YwlC family protein [Flexivirga oryzae]|uniref:tRNA A37 threonylcarbamoyladenosine synthetase subunit TsaC/SUA5/YrdC n=1 Tax=Flexivirga oryzae TaxID=1794944 RepID=A0A839N2E4_9MICO|nr:Sua5/YciO/YrdC/YwlC family protein [Flexivirga oryzae]MBB2891910.1 tRNA A37 threonylcarbamoyladenosine synthetase subunit TsaC/SUA5/YrdC [Flexivirga oryzae]